MDVRCEKCQTEYELDESRLKPGGVTVKCTNCGHMFKIRKRPNTNVGLPASSGQITNPQITNPIVTVPPVGERPRAPSKQPPSPPAGSSGSMPAGGSDPALD